MVLMHSASLLPQILRELLVPLQFFQQSLLARSAGIHVGSVLIAYYSQLLLCFSRLLCHLCSGRFIPPKLIHKLHRLGMARLCSAVRCIPFTKKSGQL